MLLFHIPLESSERNFLLHLRSLIYLVDQAGQVPAVRLDDQERLIRLLIQLVGDNALAKDFVVQFLRTKSLDWFFRPRFEAVTLTQAVNSSKDEAAIKEDEVFDFQGQADEGEKIMLIHLAAKEILPGKLC